jgi:3-keto-5-aminohexanoate cleavage enzyme
LQRVRGCPSSDDLRLIRHFEKGGSGSSGVRV